VKEHRGRGREESFVNERLRCERTLVAKVCVVSGAKVRGFEAWNCRALCISSVWETHRAIQTLT